MTTGDVLVDAEFIKWFATLGIGGVLAGFMFMFYRKDIKQYTELWRMTTEQTILVVKENTATITKLNSLIESQETIFVRKTDFEQLLVRKIAELKILAEDTKAEVNQVKDKVK